MNGISIVSDTNPLIYLLNGSQKAAGYLHGKQVWISVIFELELFGKKGLTKAEKKRLIFNLPSRFHREFSDVHEVYESFVKLTYVSC